MTTVAAGALSFYLRFIMNAEPRFLIFAGFGPNVESSNEEIPLNFWEQNKFSKIDDYVKFVKIQHLKDGSAGQNFENDEEIQFGAVMPPYLNKVDRTIFASLFMMALFILVIGYTLWVKRLPKICQTRRKLYRR